MPPLNSANSVQNINEEVKGEEQAVEISPVYAGLLRSKTYREKKLEKKMIEKAECTEDMATKYIVKQHKQKGSKKCYLMNKIDKMELYHFIFEDD